MNQEVLIICESIYHGNTKKLADAMARKMNCKVVNCEQAMSEELSRYQVIGFGSGIYFTSHHPELISVVSKMNENQKAFVFSSHGAPFLGKYHNKIKDELQKRKIRLIGEFSCRGYDCTGPYNLVHGGNKGKPNEKDLRKAEMFIDKILPQYVKDTETVKNGGHIELRKEECILCGKCAAVCPMKVFRRLPEQIEITDEKNCIHCSLCKENCPSQAISIHHTWKENVAIAKQNAWRKSL